MADAVCRCAGALSRALRYWMPPHRVGVENGSPPSPGLASARTRRSPPRPTVTASPASAARATTVSHRHSHGTARGAG